jgi:hypothetical protein
MSQDLFAIYGVSGCGRGVMPIARSQLRQQGISDDRLVFVDDNPNAPVVNGQRVMTYAQFLSEPARKRHAVLAIANGTIRERLALRCVEDGVAAWSEGLILCPFVTVTSNIRIGQHFHANLYSYVEHDCMYWRLRHLRAGSQMQWQHRDRGPCLHRHGRHHQAGQAGPAAGYRQGRRGGHGCGGNEGCAGGGDGGRQSRKALGERLNRCAEYPVFPVAQFFA